MWNFFQIHILKILVFGWIESVSATKYDYQYCNRLTRRPKFDTVIGQNVLLQNYPPMTDSV